MDIVIVIVDLQADFSLTSFINVSCGLTIRKSMSSSFKMTSFETTPLAAVQNPVKLIL